METIHDWSFVAIKVDDVPRGLLARPSDDEGVGAFRDVSPHETAAVAPAASACAAMPLMRKRSSLTAFLAANPTVAAMLSDATVQQHEPMCLDGRLVASRHHLYSGVVHQKEHSADDEAMAEGDDDNSDDTNGLFIEEEEDDNTADSAAVKPTPLASASGVVVEAVAFASSPTTATFSSAANTTATTVTPNSEPSAVAAAGMNGGSVESLFPVIASSVHDAGSVNGANTLVGTQHRKLSAGADGRITSNDALVDDDEAAVSATTTAKMMPPAHVVQSALTTTTTPATMTEGFTTTPFPQPTNPSTTVTPPPQPSTNFGEFFSLEQFIAEPQPVAPPPQQPQQTAVVVKQRKPRTVTKKPARPASPTPVRPVATPTAPPAKPNPLLDAIYNNGKMTPKQMVIRDMMLKQQMLQQQQGGGNSVSVGGHSQQQQQLAAANSASRSPTLRASSMTPSSVVGRASLAMPRSKKARAELFLSPVHIYSIPPPPSPLVGSAAPATGPTMSPLAAPSGGCGGNNVGSFAGITTSPLMAYGMPSAAMTGASPSAGGGMLLPPPLMGDFALPPSADEEVAATAKANSSSQQQPQGRLTPRAQPLGFTAPPPLPPMLGTTAAPLTTPTSGRKRGRPSKQSVEAAAAALSHNASAVATPATRPLVSMALPAITALPTVGAIGDNNTSMTNVPAFSKPQPNHATNPDTRRSDSNASGSNATPLNSSQLFTLDELNKELLRVQHQQKVQTWQAEQQQQQHAHDTAAFTKTECVGITAVKEEAEDHDNASSSTAVKAQGTDDVTTTATRKSSAYAPTARKQLVHALMAVDMPSGDDDAAVRAVDLRVALVTAIQRGTAGSTSDTPSAVCTSLNADSAHISTPHTPANEDTLLANVPTTAAADAVVATDGQSPVVEIPVGAGYATSSSTSHSGKAGDGGVEANSKQHIAGDSSQSDNNSSVGPATAPAASHSPPEENANASMPAAAQPPHKKQPKPQKRFRNHGADPTTAMLLETLGGGTDCGGRMTDSHHNTTGGSISASNQHDATSTTTASSSSATVLLLAFYRLDKASKQSVIRALRGHVKRNAVVRPHSKRGRGDDSHTQNAAEALRNTTTNNSNGAGANVSIIPLVDLAKYRSVELMAKVHQFSSTEAADVEGAIVSRLAVADL